MILVIEFILNKNGQNCPTVFMAQAGLSGIWLSIQRKGCSDTAGRTLPQLTGPVLFQRSFFQFHSLKKTKQSITTT